MMKEEEEGVEEEYEKVEKVEEEGKHSTQLWFVLIVPITDENNLSKTSREGKENYTFFKSTILKNK